MRYYGNGYVAFWHGRKEGGRVVLQVLVRDILFLPSLCFSSLGVAGTTKLCFCQNIYLTHFAIHASILVHAPPAPPAPHNPYPKTLYNTA